MKVVKLSEVRNRIKDLVQEANFELQDDVLKVIKEMAAKEEAPAGKEVFNQMLQNAQIAREEKLGLCQDTGLAVFSVELGEDGLDGLLARPGIRGRASADQHPAQGRCPHH